MGGKRSVWKGPFVDSALLKKVNTLDSKSKEGGRVGMRVVKTWSRRSTIIPQFVGMTFQVHNGKTFTPVFVGESMVGHKFGEFAPTKTFRGHSANRKANLV